jgi:hypothetical protein
VFKVVNAFKLRFKIIIIFLIFSLLILLTFLTNHAVNSNPNRNTFIVSEPHGLASAPSEIVNGFEFSPVRYNSSVALVGLVSENSTKLTTELLGGEVQSKKITANKGKLVLNFPLPRNLQKNNNLKIRVTSEIYFSGKILTDSIVVSVPKNNVAASYNLNITDTLGTPVRWDPCKTFYYKVNPINLPEHGLTDISKAFSLLKEASGYDFVYAGETNIIPYSTDSNSWEFNTLTIAFTDTETVPTLKDYFALGGVVYNPGNNEVVAGSVLVNVNKLNRMTKGFSSNEISLGRVLLHELGHATNLNHVWDPSQVMYEFILPVKGPNKFQVGDKLGFSKLTSLGCFTS